MEDRPIKATFEEMKNLTNPEYNKVLFDSFSFRLRQAKNALYRISKMENRDEIARFAVKALDILDSNWRNRINHEQKRSEEIRKEGPRGGTTVLGQE
mgnify:CR=1 FL=1|jgi:hypothetical protein